MRYPSSLALEMIDVQKDDFFERLTAIIQKYVHPQYHERESYLKYAEELEKSIKDRLNIIVKVDVFTEFGPAVYIPDFRKNHVLLNKIQQWVMDGKTSKDLFKIEKPKDLESWVDRKHAKVNGVFSESPYTISFPASMLHHPSMSAKMIAATLLHELGHLFTYFEYIGRAISTNQVMATVTRALSETDDEKQRKIIIKKAANTLELDDIDIDALADTSKKGIVETVLYKASLTKPFSESGNAKYDEVSFEQLSDQFAARFGAGKDLVLALSFLESDAGFIGYRSNISYYLLETLKAMVGILALVGAGVAISVTNPFAVFYFILIFFALSSIDAAPDGYDRSAIRLKRVREDIIVRMKEKGLTKPQFEDLKKDLDCVDEVMKEVKDRRQWSSYVAEFLFASKRDRYAAERLQQNLESLANNDLFTMSQQLKFAK